MLLRLLALAGAPVELAEAEVAVGDEGAHAELVGQSEGLAVVGLGPVALRRIPPRGDFADKAQGICVGSTLLVIAGEVEGTLSTFECVLHAASQQIRLAQTSETMAPASIRGGLLQQRQSLSNAPGQGIRHA